MEHREEIPYFLITTDIFFRELLTVQVCRVIPCQKSAQEFQVFLLFGTRAPDAVIPVKAGVQPFHLFIEIIKAGRVDPRTGFRSQFRSYFMYPVESAFRLPGGGTQRPVIEVAFTGNQCFRTRFGIFRAGEGIIFQASETDSSREKS